MATEDVARSDIATVLSVATLASVARPSSSAQGLMPHMPSSFSAVNRIDPSAASTQAGKLTGTTRLCCHAVLHACLALRAVNDLS